MLCQIVNSLLLLPVSVARPLLSYLLDLLPPLDRLNRLLPAAVLLEDQELQWPLHGKTVGIILRQMDFMNFRVNMALQLNASCLPRAFSSVFHARNSITY